MLVSGFLPMLTSPNISTFDQAPFDHYAQLREHQPVGFMKTALGEGWAVSRYDDVLTVLRDVRFSNERRKLPGGKDLTRAWWMPSMFKAFANSMVMVDDPTHSRLRNLVHKGFSPRMIQQLSERIERIANDLLDAAAHKKTIDLMADFALSLPLIVISEMLGVPEKDREKFHIWSSKLMDLSSATSLLTVLPQVPVAFKMQRFFSALIKSHRRHPQNDLTTALIMAQEDGETLSDDELVAMLFLLLLAGHETTVNLIGSGTLALLEHPDQLELLKAHPEHIDTAIEEMLRYTNPVHHVAPRFTLEEVTLSGVTIPAHQMVLAHIASANRDPRAFPNPDIFDITRTTNKHIGFGMGIHYCLGAPLARLEGRIAFNVLLKRYPNVRLAVPSDQLAWRSAEAIRGLKALPVTLA
jgi:cytochrome P450 PksS